MTTPEKQIVTNPFTLKGLGSVLIGTGANYGAGKLGEFLGVRNIRVGAETVPNIFGPVMNIGPNAAGTLLAMLQQTN